MKEESYKVETEMIDFYILDLPAMISSVIQYPLKMYSCFPQSSYETMLLRKEIKYYHRLSVGIPSASDFTAFSRLEILPHF